MRTLAIAALLSALGFSTACFSSSYVAQQALGQLKTLNGRERVMDVLRRKNLKSEWRKKLWLMLRAREYGITRLGLRRTGAYTYFFDTKGEPIAHNVSAAAKDALKPKRWTFPIVGSLPYLGFFRKADGEKLRKELAAQGYDTYLRPVPAYSSLGWFNDPVYSTMLDQSRARLIEVVIHETTHTTIFLRNRIPFNESLAVFIGQQGTLDFLSETFGRRSKEVKDVRRAIARRKKFSSLITKLYDRLEKLYAEQIASEQKIRRREAIFAWAQQAYRKLFADPKMWGSFVNQRLNNAIVLSYGRYNHGVDFHQRVYDALGRNLGQMIALYKHAQLFDDPIAYVAKRCGVPAPLTGRVKR
jgi:predicted aminopeptidase